MVDGESSRLSARFAEMKCGGLVDVKFLLRDTPNATTEVVCGEVNDVMDAFERGDAVEFTFNDSKK